MKNLFIAAMMLSALTLAACGASPPANNQVAIPSSTPTNPPPTATIPQPTTAIPTETSAPPPTDIPPPTATAVPTEPPPAVASLSAEQQAILANFPAKGAAPAVRNEVWLNSDPLPWESLAGKVVIVDFWTYG